MRADGRPGRRGRRSSWRPELLAHGGNGWIYRSDEGLPKFCQVMANAALFVAGSTGPCIAAAMDVPTVGFFPAHRSATPLRWRPLNGEGRHLPQPAGRQRPPGGHEPARSQGHGGRDRPLGAALLARRALRAHTEHRQTGPGPLSCMGMRPYWQASLPGVVPDSPLDGPARARAGETCRYKPESGHVANIHAFGL